MNFKKIVAFGDSWVWGDEILDPGLVAHRHDAHAVNHENTPYRERMCFAGQLGTYYRVPVENFGIPGGSLQSAIWTFLWWLEHEPNPQTCLVIHGITTPHRQSFYDPNHIHYDNDPPWNNFVHSPWIANSTMTDEFVELFKLHTVKSVNQQFSKLNYNKTLMFFDGFASYIPLLQINLHYCDQTIVAVNSLINPDSHINQELMQNPDRPFLKPQGHPSELGHEFIALKLIKEIDHAKANRGF